jgi:purine-nucleoside phosphorylase
LEARARAAAAFLRASGLRPAVPLAVMLGSGLSEVVAAQAPILQLPYATIPGFPVTSVAGHPGELRVVELAGAAAAFFCGRIHGYEGWSARDVSFPVRVAAALGVHTLVVTNASGGVDPSLSPGELVLIADQLNLTGDSPLRGPHEPSLGPRFPDMTNAFDWALREEAKTRAPSLFGRPLREAVYAGVNGPAYETPAEVRMLRALGAGLVGMSTVHEVIAARHAGLRVLGLSLVANHAAGVTTEPLRHEDVTRAAAAGAGDLGRLLHALAPALVTPPRASAAMAGAPAP